MRAKRSFAQIIIASIFFCGAAFADTKVYTGWLSNTAIKGYDAVAYHTQGQPVKGSDNHSVSWNGADWHFSSAENKALFAATPEKYAPQYGGYCAFAVAKNDLVKIDPQAWTIADGKLYLNYSKKIQKKWEADRASFIAKADTNWPKLGAK